MKKLILAGVLLLLSCYVFSQDYILKSDFQVENQKLKEQINVLKSKNYEARSSIETMRQDLDSLQNLTVYLKKELINHEERARELSSTQDRMLQLVNSNEEEVAKRFYTYMWLLIIGWILLFAVIIVLFLIQLKKMRNLDSDLEKSNEAINLHVKNTGEEITLLNSGLEKVKTDSEASLGELKAETELAIQNLNADVAQNNQALKDQISGLEQALKKQKDLIESNAAKWSKDIEDLHSQIKVNTSEMTANSKKQAEELTKLKEQLKGVEKSLREEFQNSLQNLASLNGRMDEHIQKMHKK